MENNTAKNEFDPSGVGVKNGNFIGLPFDEETANVVLLPVPWDVTVSFGEGTGEAPEAIREASVQLDLYDPDVKCAWKKGIFMLPFDGKLWKVRNEIRPLANDYIDFLEKGGICREDAEMTEILKKINKSTTELNSLVYQKTKDLLDRNKKIGVVGGDHSVPLGFIKALSEKYSELGILHIDAHLDLRKSYEGFTHSHASVFYNALRLKGISKLVSVGIRDYCEEEISMVKEEGDRIEVFFDQSIRENSFKGENWNRQCDKILTGLPENVYVSFDIDGLDPKLCPGTGTPVPGGLEYFEAIFLLKKLVESGRKIIGFDVCEVGKTDFDANVGARIIYKLCNLMGLSE